ncbi:hypothetical protein T484DRAFT_1893563, partial [Baffinella frigidus]
MKKRSTPEAFTKRFDKKRSTLEATKKRSEKMKNHVKNKTGAFAPEAIQKHSDKMKTRRQRNEAKREDREYHESEEGIGAMEGRKGVTVACLALGSRGDVEPLLAVLERLLTLTPSVHVTLACREAVWDEIVAHGPAKAGVTLAPVRALSVAMARAMHARKQGLP